ncbi:hypothetical protein K469DRAFT_721501 [Zopfia rhizophila CBS 207.26]|uniref:Uncharacterized protein n=1 Tax=Zopfia rhizophila CBS 207.26 TaxID=1314779 RepID=A0A6A6EL25_9PEZI|nr:hypothetical protein K469DRAFT_721501 [Zopfia rhizophila CBS 207.26]
MEDPDHGWKPNGRPQSTIARNFMSELDDLFKLDGGLDKLDKNVHQKKQAVSSHTQELEALEARLRETEERLKQAKSSPPAARKNSQRRTPIRGTLPDEDKAQLGESSSPLAHAQARQRSGADLKTAKDMPGALPETPASYNSAEYVIVDRPHSAQNSEDEQV